MVLIRYNTPHSPAAIEQYPCVAFPRPFELGAGRELFFVGHGTPKKCKIGMRVPSPFSCKIGLSNHSRISPEQIELFVFHPIYEQSAARTVREQQEKRSCVGSRQPLKIEQLGCG